MARIEEYVGTLLESWAVYDVDDERVVWQTLHDLLMAVCRFELMADKERYLTMALCKKLQHHFETRFSLKERKETKKKKNFPPNPLIKEKQTKETEEKTYICVGDADLEAFRKECLGYVGQYDQQLVANFFNYFTQRDANGMMHFQNEPYWDTGKRLALWVNNPISAASTAAALRLQKQKQQAKQQAIAQSRSDDNARLEQEIEERKRNAVSYEEWLASKNKEAET